MSLNHVVNQSFKKELQGSYLYFKAMGQIGSQGVKQDYVYCGHLNPVQSSC